ncbi:MAG: hypothetical protein O2985_12805 [Proteobacteria bacterium]|nr:hypothetical protein [Pseudomonadota bacterium]
MTAIAIPLPEDIEAVRNGLVEFARAEVLPRHAAHRDLFENPRRYTARMAVSAMKR